MDRSIVAYLEKLYAYANHGLGVRQVAMLIPSQPQARSMKPNAYKDVMTERWVADICAYPACDNGPRKPYNAEQPMVSP